MKKFLCALLAFGMTFATVACGGNGDNGGTSSSVDNTVESSQLSESVSSEENGESVSDGSDESWEEFIPDYASTSDMIEYFSGKTGEVTYQTGKDLTIESLYVDEPIYLGDRSENNVFTVDCGADFERTLTIVGSGGGVVQANGGVLVLKHMTIKNDTNIFTDNDYRAYYAEFGGKVRFENCKIECPIQLRNDAEAEFINCEIKSLKEDEYGIWVADGSAKFDGCKFTGYRALKVHEVNGMDVVNVSVENCFFQDLSKKPAIAIDVAEEKSTTTIAFTNCYIYNCAEWTKDSQEGVDGFYESDQDTTTFTFTASDCTLDGTPFSFAGGEISYHLP